MVQSAGQRTSLLRREIHYATGAIKEDWLPSFPAVKFATKCVQMPYTKCWPLFIRQLRIC